MTKLEQDRSIGSEDALEKLLRSAGPRPMPRRRDRELVREAVRAEWRTLTRRRRRRQFLRYAIAAGIVVATLSMFNLYRAPDVSPVVVASIEKSFGAVYLLGEHAELQETADLERLASGQVIVTGPDSGLAIGWGTGGSLRVDERSRIEFVSGNAVRLLAGKIYFDSRAGLQSTGVTPGPVLSFTVRTGLGEVRHRGTQFMTEIAGESLAVSVREGSVLVDGRYYRHTARAGEQVTFTGRARPTVLDLRPSGQAWQWVSGTTPVVDVDGRTLHEFLVWACRELGLELRFDGASERIAHDAILRGTIDTEPAEALRLRLASAAMAWQIDEGVITISEMH